MGLISGKLRPHFSAVEICQLSLARNPILGNAEYYFPKQWKVMQVFVKQERSLPSEGDYIQLYGVCIIIDITKEQSEKFFSYCFLTAMFRTFHFFLIK